MAGHIAITISEGTINIPNNSSPVTVNVYYYGNGVSYNNDKCSGTIYIDGTAYSFSHKFTTSTSAQLLGSATKPAVAHGPDGKKTVSCSARFVTDVSLGTLTASGSKELTTIPRVSDLTLDVDTIAANGIAQVIATAVKKSSSFTDTLKVSLGTYSQDIISGAAFTIPAEWINAISGTSAVAKVTVTTKSGTTTIGTKSVDLTVTVPESVVPTISGVTVTEAIAAVTAAFGNRFVKSLSQLNVEVDAAGVYGSTIKSYKVVLDGVTYIQQAFTSNLINSSGTVNAVVTVTDSRGRTATYTKPIMVVDYTPPTIAGMSYKQCDADGTVNSTGACTKIEIAGTVSSVEGQNTKALLLKCKKTSEEVYTERAITLPDWAFDTETIISNTDPTVTYEYIAILTDKIGTTQNKITTGIPALSFYASGKGACFFGEADADGLWVNNGASKMRLSFTASELAELNQLVGGGGNTFT